MGWKTKAVSLVVLLLAFAIGSCDFSEDAVEDRTEEFALPENLASGTNILAVTNTSAVNATLSFSLANRSALQTNATIQPRLTGNWNSAEPRMGTEAASRFNANPPPIPPESSRSIEDGPRQAKVYTDTNQKFWVTDAQDKFYEITTTKQAFGTHCNIWVHNDSIGTGTGKITVTQAQNLADKFDAIYPRETNLLGYERGGGNGGDGGIDGDAKIQILVYDIEDEGVVGYFWGKDEYTQTQLDNSVNRGMKSNEAEIFYIDVKFYNGDEKDSATGQSHPPELVYSTLIHEFQHMINFNQKALRLGKSSATWYDEMLAMLTEDVIGPLVGIAATSNGHVIQKRIPLFLGAYWLAGVNQWLEGDNVMLSYSAVYAFGAYLIRNYGGPKLINAMLGNNALDQASITQALQSIPGQSSLSFDTALERFFEALLYSPANTVTVPSGKMTFNKTESYNEGYVYTAHAFDIWTMAMHTDMLAILQANYPTFVSDYTKGPIIFPLLQEYQSPGYSVCLQKLDSSRAGQTLVVNISPGNATIKMKVENY